MEELLPQTHCSPLGSNKENFFFFSPPAPSPPPPQCFCLLEEICCFQSVSSEVPSVFLLGSYHALSINGKINIASTLKFSCHHLMIFSTICNSAPLPGKDVFNSSYRPPAS